MIVHWACTYTTNCVDSACLQTLAKRIGKTVKRKGTSIVGPNVALAVGKATGAVLCVKCDGELPDCT